jgi:uncharacterized protein (DUF58 family)
MRFTSSGVSWLLIGSAVGAFAWYKSINLVLILVYTMGAMVVLNGILAWRAVRRATARRVPMPPAFAGERAECGVTVTNHSRLPITVSVADQAAGASNSFLVYRLPAGQTLSCSAPREFPARGKFTGTVNVLSGFPLGFVECERPCETSGEIVVLPRLGYAEPDGLRRWLSRQAGAEGFQRRVVRRVTGDFAEVRGVRPYRQGDALRDVHWRTTARRGELMVREYDIAPSLELLLVVEAWLPPNPTPADRERLEAALCLAVTIAMTWRRAFDSPVTVAVPGAERGVASAASEDELRAALAPLAGVAGGGFIAPPPPEAFHRHLASGARVVVSSRANTPLAAALSRSTGKSFFPVSPADRLPWYQPPAAAKDEKPAKSPRKKEPPRRAEPARPAAPPRHT